MSSTYVNLNNPIFLEDPVFHWVETLIVPFYFMAIVEIMAWGSLQPAQSNAKSRKKAAHAYLYLDGAYGFWPQLFLAALYPFGSMGDSDGIIPIPKSFAVTLRVLFTFVSIYQLYITRQNDSASLVQGE